MQKKPSHRYPHRDAFSADLASLLHRLESPSAEAISDARKFEALRALPFFKGFRDVEVWEVLRIASWQRFSAGRTILREGERGESFFVLVDGDVEVSRGAVSLAALTAGACFGEMLYFEEPQTLRTTTVRARTDAVAIEVRALALGEASSRCQLKFNRAFLRILLGRLDGANRRIAGQ
jgi:CRP-like cAMP-binding protein